MDKNGLRKTDSPVLLRGEVELAEVLFLDVVEEVAVDGVRRPLPLQLEDDHAGVVAGGEQVQRRVGGDDPEAVVLAPDVEGRKNNG